MSDTTRGGMMDDPMLPPSEIRKYRQFPVGPDGLTDPERELAEARELLRTVWSIVLGASCKITDGSPHHAQGMIDAALTEIEEYLPPDNASGVAKETRDDG